jgi:hypothetical protein
MNKEEFISEIEFCPDWVHTKSDALDYSRHLNYRLIQQKSNYNLLFSLIKEYYPDFLDTIIEKIEENQFIYDTIYNDTYHPAIAEARTKQNINVVK